MNSKFSVLVKDIRAIKEAEINLNGITVLSGENGCGKTTISKLLYVFVKTSVNFDSVLSSFYSEKFGFLSSILMDFIPKKNSDFQDAKLENPFSYDADSSIRDFSNNVNSQEYILNVILPNIKRIKESYINHEYSISRIAFSRLLRLYERRVRKCDVKNPIELLDDYESYMQSLLQEITDAKNVPSLKIFNSQFTRYFNENADKWNYSFKEYESNLIDKKNKSVTLQRSFSEAVYVDVPTVFDNEDYRIPSRVSTLVDLRRNLIKNNTFLGNNSISSVIDETLKGKISRRDEMFSRIFLYTAKNGQSIPLSQAASGLKCFAVLERLYANGILNEDTLLIVDEPEVHLHPKWIVEYARILVLIQKYLHTTILIASHNPDMISAIKYISEKEEISDSLTFYIAEEIETEGFGKYKFKNLGRNIEDIFSSFNIALDRINLYGAISDD